MVGCVIAVGAVAATGLLTIRMMIQPIELVRSAFAAIAKGESGVRVRYGAKNELGEIATSFDRIAARLADLEARIESPGPSSRRCRDTTSPSRPAELPPPADWVEPASGPARVLLAVAENGPASELGAFLRANDFEVLEATDHDDVLAVARQAAPDVVILGDGFGSTNTLACVGKLKEASVTRTVSVVVIRDGGAADATAEIGSNEAFDDCLHVPVCTESVVVRIRSMARLSRCERALVHSNDMLTEHRRVMSLLFDYSRGLSSALALGAVLAKTVSVAAALTRCRRVSIMLPDEKNEFLVIADAIGQDLEAARSVRVPMDGAMAGWVFESDKPVEISTPSEAQRYLPRYETGLFGTLPLVSSPLRAAAQVVGIMNLSDREDGRPFEPHQLEYIDQISHVAATAIADLKSRKSRDGARDSIVEVLGVLAEYRDDNTGRHIERVTQYSLLLAEELRASDAFRTCIDEQFLRDLKRAVPLHDIGKVGIPDRILLKPGSLTSDEAEIMRQHVHIGAETIRSVRHRVPGAGYLAMAEEIAACHHEWYDGTGYPRKLSGKEIPLPARIIALADVYDALTTERPYKSAYTHGEATAMIIDAEGTQFDPAVVKAFRGKAHHFSVLAGELVDPTDVPDVRRDPLATPPDPADDAEELYPLAPA